MREHIYLISRWDINKGKGYIIPLDNWIKYLAGGLTAVQIREVKSGEWDENKLIFVQN